MKALPLLLLIAPTFLFIGQASKAEDAGMPGGSSVARHASAAPELREDILSHAGELEAQGQFKEATELLSDALGDKSTTTSRRKTLEFELDRLDRIKKDYSFSRTGLFDALKKSVADFKEDEFKQWIEEGRFDSRTIDGERRFTSTSVSNLFFRHPELEPRRRPRKDTRDLQHRFLESCRAIRKAALAEKSPYVLPKRFRATMTVSAEAGARAAGFGGPRVAADSARLSVSGRFQAALVLPGASADRRCRQPDPLGPSETAYRLQSPVRVQDRI